MQKSKLVLEDSFETIRYRDGKLEIINQLLIPEELIYVHIKGVKDGWNAIREMQVRGAPAIAIVGMLSLAVELREQSFVEMKQFCKFIKDNLKYLLTARPTAINITHASNYIMKLSDSLSTLGDCGIEVAKREVLTYIEKMIHNDVESNKKIGKNGAEAILADIATCKKINILTHCNTGSLATAGYGTALGVIRSLYAANAIERVYCTETRPYNQGSRLTAFELLHDRIPATLITDSMASLVISTRNISAVIVGADRILCNGDTINKIGTYQLAITAKYHRIAFYVAAPVTTIALNEDCEVVIEERSHKEVKEIKGVQIAPQDVDVYNPAFDVTPAELITAIITDVGVFTPKDLWQIAHTSESHFR